MQKQQERSSVGPEQHDQSSVGPEQHDLSPGGPESSSFYPYNVSKLDRPGSEVVHSIHYEEWGDPDGAPLLLVHGTALPFESDQLEFLKGLNVRAIVFHQRGVGLSSPADEIRENTTSHTISDIEALREHLGIESWGILGWSLGSTTSVLYAEKHPNSCNALALAGTFLASNEEYQQLLENDYRDHQSKWSELAKLTSIPLSENTLSQIVKEIEKKFRSEDQETVHTAMRVWLDKPTDFPISPDTENYLKVNFHYKVNGYFIDSNELLEAASTLVSLDTVAVRGESDGIVPRQSTEILVKSIGAGSIIDVEADHFFKSEEAQQLLHQVISEQIN